MTIDIISFLIKHVTVLLGYFPGSYWHLSLVAVIGACHCITMTSSMLAPSVSDCIREETGHGIIMTISYW